MPRWGRRESAVQDVPTEERYSLTDEATAVLLGGYPNYSGESVTAESMLSLSAVYRAVSLISQIGGTLPLKTYREDPETKIRERMPAFLEDRPAGPDALMTSFQWKEQIFLHALIHGEIDLFHVRNQAGALVGLQPVHPSAVAVYEDLDVRGGERYTVSVNEKENRRLTPYGDTRDDPGMTRIVGPRTKGLRGWSPLRFAGTSFGIGLAAERATANMFKNGALVPTVLTPADGEEISDADARKIKADLSLHLFGREHAGTIPLINRILKPMSLGQTNMDAQFMENRQFQIEEVARWFGVPPFLLMQLDKQTSWGTGIAEQNKNLAQYVLYPWCKRIEEALSRLLPQPRWVEFDFYALTAGSAQQEQDLLLGSVNGGLRTLNEARRILNLAPVAGGDELRIPSGVMLQSQLEASAAATEAETAAVEGGTDGTADAGIPGGDNG